MAIKKWKTINSEIIFRSNWFDIIRKRVHLPHNDIDLDNYYVVSEKDSAMVVAVDEMGNLIMKSEYRLPVDEVLLELPAGNLESGEEPIMAAKRELLEETGYASETWCLISRTYDCPNRCNNALYIYLAEDAKKVSSQYLDRSENIEVTLVPFEKAVNMCLDGTIKVNSCVNGILNTAIKKRKVLN